MNASVWFAAGAAATVLLTVLLVGRRRRQTRAAHDETTTLDLGLYGAQWQQWPHPAAGTPAGIITCPSDLTSEQADQLRTDFIRWRQAYLQPAPKAAAGIVVIVRAVQTCLACPSQWDAWTDTGQYLYLRYRGGVGTADAYDTAESALWEHPPTGSVARFGEPDLGDGCIELDEFCARAGLDLADDAVIE